MRCGCRPSSGVTFRCALARLLRVSEPRVPASVEELATILCELSTE